MTIAIIDNYQVLRNGLKLFLRENLDDVRLLEAKSIWSFQDTYPDELPEVIIIGLSQDSLMTNFRIIEFANSKYDMGTVILYDEQTDYLRMSQYFNTGVCNYLSKQFDVSELTKCITNILKGKSSGALKVLSSAGSHLGLPKGHYGKKVLLTKREFEIALYLSDGMSNSWIARKLVRRPSTISTIKSSIFKKMAVDNIVMLRDVLKLT